MLWTHPVKIRSCLARNKVFSKIRGKGRLKNCPNKLEKLSLIYLAIAA